VFRTYLETGDPFLCYGCGACKEVCPEQAIQMVKDEEGFLYPQVEEALCKNCGACKKACIEKTDAYKNREEAPEVYLAYAKEKEVSMHSTGGGVLAEAVKSICESGGAAAGIAFKKNWNVAYDLTEKAEEYKKV
ncbi:4Fe-4S ferredoxin iron-sulfur binding domain-containing protein, partial [gut metagenome]